MNNRSEPMLAHNVFFTLKDGSPDQCSRLVEACHKYLKQHPGVVFFAAGLRDAELQRPVNDQTFHVGLQVVFENRSAHDAYQSAAEHLQFIEENQQNWAEVRVFDSLVI